MQALRNIHVRDLQLLCRDKKKHKGSLGDHIQETNSEDQGDTDLLFPLEVQIPDNPLR